MPASLEVLEDVAGDDAGHRIVDALLDLETSPASRAQYVGNLEEHDVALGFGRHGGVSMISRL
jgi:hypothetical protein